eukprot:scaffold68030_cov86-Cyclotella_meneghiniana.AAC.2
MYTRLKDGKVSNPDWDGFLHLMKEKYKRAFNPHMCEVHLNEDPSSLGARCAGLPGQVSSTNGMEKRGGNIQDQYKIITRYVSKANRHALHGVFAYAKDIDASCSIVDEFAFEPEKSLDDYDYARVISGFARTC